MASSEKYCFCLFAKYFFPVCNLYLICVSLLSFPLQIQQMREEMPPQRWEPTREKVCKRVLCQLGNTICDRCNKMMFSNFFADMFSSLSCLKHKKVIASDLWDFFSPFCNVLLVCVWTDRVRASSCLRPWKKLLAIEELIPKGRRRTKRCHHTHTSSYNFFSVHFPVLNKKNCLDCEIVKNVDSSFKSF